MHQLFPTRSNNRHQSDRLLWLQWMLATLLGEFFGFGIVSVTGAVSGMVMGILLGTQGETR